MTVAISDLILRKLETTGNSSEMSVDGSSTSVEFTYTVPSGKTLNLRGLMGRMQTPKQAGVPDHIPSAGFGNSTTKLSKGLQVYIRNGFLETKIDFTVDGAIKRNCDWGNLSGSEISQLGSYKNSAGTSFSDCFAFTLDYVKQFGDAVAVPTGYQIVVKVRDDLTNFVNSLEISVFGTLT